MTDIDAVAGEPDLRDEIRKRLRRSLDRLGCAQSVAEALCGGFGVDASDGGCDEEANPMESVLGAMEKLAREWPTDYSAEAVEWLVLDESRY